MTMGLFERWLEIERSSGRTLAEILADLNDACGSKYKHNWPSVMASRGYSLDRLPVGVRQYMMARVLPVVLEESGTHLKPERVMEVVSQLT